MPARIRSFEGEYGKYVVTDANTAAIAETLTAEVVALVGGAQARLSQALVTKLKEAAKFVRVPNALAGGQEGVGNKPIFLRHVFNPGSQL